MMLRSLLLAAAALLLSSSASACTCLPGTPPPLSQCNTADNEAALLVTITCVKMVVGEFNIEEAVAKVVIDKIFDDNTGLGLSVGDTTAIKSRKSSAACGVGGSFAPGDQWIMFATPASDSPPAAQIDDLAANVGGRRLQQGVRGPAKLVNPTVEPEPEFDSVFTHTPVCDVSDAELKTHLCAGNIIEPKAAQIEELMQGCSSIFAVPAVFTTKTQR